EFLSSPHHEIIAQGNDSDIDMLDQDDDPTSPPCPQANSETTVITNNESRTADTQDSKSLPLIRNTRNSKSSEVTSNKMKSNKRKRHAEQSATNESITTATTPKKRGRKKIPVEII